MGSVEVFVLMVVAFLVIMLMVAAVQGFGNGPSKTRAGDVWPGVKLGYLRMDGVTYTEDALDGAGVSGLEAWAADASLRDDVVEAWISRVTGEGVIRVYWIDGERDRTEAVAVFPIPTDTVTTSPAEPADAYPVLVVILLSMVVVSLAGSLIKWLWKRRYPHPLPSVLGYRRHDGQIFTKHAEGKHENRDEWLDAWAARRSRQPDVTEAWVTRVSSEGHLREYWVKGEPERSEWVLDSQDAS